MCKELLLIRLEWSAVCLPAPGTSPRSWWWGRWRTRSCPSARRCSEAVCPSCRFYRRVEGCRLSSRSPEHDDTKRTTRARLDDLTGVWLIQTQIVRHKLQSTRTLKQIKTREKLYFTCYLMDGCKFQTVLLVLKRSHDANYQAHAFIQVLVEKVHIL